MTRYFGKLCDKHPQFKGERYKANGACRGCLNEQSAKWQRDNPDRAKRNDKRWRKDNAERVKSTRYLRRYGITKAEKDKIFAQQNERCGCCGGSSGTWHLDHDHKTRRIRGVLCSHCNWMLGHAKDSVDVLRAAIKYLQKHKKQSKLKTNKESNE